MIFETERLYVTKWKPNDLAALHELYNDPAIREFISPKLTLEETQQIFENQLSLYHSQFPFGRYFIAQKRSDKFIGLLLLKEDNTKSGVEIGYSLIKNEWQKGYATEIVKAAVNWIFQQDRFVSVSAVTELINEKSTNVLLKCGFQSQKVFIEYSSTKHLFNLNKNVPVVL
jgi:ribosomal-protein-alanine N-acetyltransferase